MLHDRWLERLMLDFVRGFSPCTPSLARLQFRQARRRSADNAFRLSPPIDLSRYQPTAKVSLGFVPVEGSFFEPAFRRRAYHARFRHVSAVAACFSGRFVLHALPREMFMPLHTSVVFPLPFQLLTFEREGAKGSELEVTAHSCLLTSGRHCSPAHAGSVLTACLQ